MRFILPIAAALAVLPWLGMGNYPLHLVIMTLLWAFVYTGWAVMGRLGLVSLGHGAFLGIGAYTVVLAWNHWGLTPWLGIALALALAALLAFVIGYPCFRFKIVGHYFALVTLALSEVVRLVVVALRDQTGGSLGATPNTAGGGGSLLALQFPSKLAWFYIMLACWLAGLWIWTRVDRSMARLALQAISEEEDAAAAVGMNVTRLKLSVTLVSALMTCAGGMFVRLGPTVGAAFTLLLAEALRLAVGHDIHGLDTTIYGLMLVLFIIFMPKGILGAVQSAWEKKRGQSRFSRPAASPTR
jgi:branched-chain amino acid transport system permease protein